MKRTNITNVRLWPVAVPLIGSVNARFRDVITLIVENCRLLLRSVLKLAFFLEADQTHLLEV
jgi:hypothetical protein